MAARWVDANKVGKSHPRKGGLAFLVRRQASLEYSGRESLDPADLGKLEWGGCRICGNFRPPQIERGRNSESIPHVPSPP